MRRSVKMLDLMIQDKYRERVLAITKYLKDYISDCEIYLFGSYAKRKITSQSDVDILILLHKQMSLEETKKLRMLLNSKYEEYIGYVYEVDIKVYNKDHFLEKTQKPSFEREISEYMIKVGEC